MPEATDRSRLFEPASRQLRFFIDGVQSQPGIIHQQ
jgi:hypothetical protein